MSNKKQILIFSGSNYRAVISFCRLLRSLNIRFAIIARTKDDLIFKTSYRSAVLATRSTHKLDYTDISRCIEEVKSVTQAEKLVICPTSEFLNLFILQNHSFFQSHNCEIPLVDLDIYRQVSNKASFSELCRNYGLRTPRRFSKNHEISPPCVAKPITNVNSANRSLYPYLIHNSKDLRYFQQTENTSDFYYEEYITGGSYYLLYYLSEHGKTHKFSQRNLLQQANGKSMLIAESADIHHEPIADRFVSMLREIGFYGLAMVELKLSNKEYVTIELNPRFWGPSQLFIDAGSDIFHGFIQDQIGYSASEAETPPERPAGQVKYLWFNGIMFDLLSGKRPRWYIEPETSKPAFILSYFFHDIYFHRDTFWLFFYELYLATRGIRKG